MPGKVLTTDAEIEQALERAAKLPPEVTVTRVEYLSGAHLDLFILHLSTGQRETIPREKLQGLNGATANQLRDIELLGDGTGLLWRELDVAHYVPDLLAQHYGNRHWMAELGRRGGAKTSDVKSRTSRANGLKGGRPRRAKAA